MQNSVTRPLSISLTFAPWICFRILKNINKMKKATTLFSTLSLVFLSLISMSSCETKKDIVATASEKAKTLTAAIKAAGLVETLQGTGPFTVFAPTDAAFAAIQSDVDNLLKPENKEQLTKVLKCHVVSGKILAKDLKDGLTLMTLDGEKLTVSIMGDGRVMVGDVHVTTPDVMTTNGVIHVVDKVIMPKMAEKTVPKMDIVAIASANAKTLAAAVTAAGLVETLQGAGPFTVFAPTDAAFAAIQKDVDKLLKPENKAKLSKVLTYHVVSGKMVAADLKDGQELVTVEGGKLKVSIKNGVVMVGNATVKMADVDASNGVIHVIDKVLMPKM
jgi:transforming growth factor-beta-induced protein